LNVDAALELISGSLGKTRAVLLGNGMGISPENRDFVNRLLPAIPDAIPVVLDADALKMVDLNKPEIRSKKLIFTPHRGELESLLGEKFDLSLPESELWPMLSEWLPDNWILDLKGSPSVTVSKDQTIINSSGGPELAIAGSGDLMAGYLAGLLAFRTERSSYLTALANFVHGRSGDFAAEKFGRYGVTIEAVSALLPEVISDLSEDEI
jgi:NAD(P)H-hydrate epimerase